MTKQKLTYKERQDAAGFKKDDRVRVTKVPPDTWGTGVYRGMIPDSIIGQRAVIVNVDSGAIEIMMISTLDTWYVPFFVLEKIGEGAEIKVGDRVKVIETTPSTEGEIHTVEKVGEDNSAAKLSNGLWYNLFDLELVKADSTGEAYSFKVPDVGDIDLQRIVRESNRPEILMVESDSRAMVAIRQDVLDLPISGVSIRFERIHSKWGCQAWKFPEGGSTSIEGYRGYSLAKDHVAGVISSLEALRAAIGPARAAVAARPKINVKVRTF